MTPFQLETLLLYVELCSRIASGADADGRPATAADKHECIVRVNAARAKVFRAFGIDPPAPRSAIGAGP